jgi:hypothetical protein
VKVPHDRVTLGPDTGLVVAGDDGAGEAQSDLQDEERQRDAHKHQH